MEPQMIRVKESLSPTSHLHSEKIRISNDAAIFEIKREMPLEGTKFSSRYEIYNSTTRPFGKSYRELTLSSSASGISSCESHSSVSSSGLSETTTYITCCSEVEPVQMTGFHCIDELSQKHSVSTFNEQSYARLHEATNYDLEPLRAHLDENGDASGDDPAVGDEKHIVANRKSFADEYTTSSSSPADSLTFPAVSAQINAKKPLVNIESWSSGGGRGAMPLKSPSLLKQVISDYESHLLYELPKSSTKTTFEEEEYTYEPKLNTSSSKTVTKCRSMLNLQLKPTDSSPGRSPSPPLTLPAKPTLSKAISETSLQQERDQEKKRIIKTISVMLENRRKQPQTQPGQPLPLQARQTNHQHANGYHAATTITPTKTRNISSTVAEAINSSLTNDNVVLIEPSRRSQTIDRSCRVTGEILKAKSSIAASAPTATYAPPDYHRNVYTLPRTMKSHRSQLQRHFYYPQYVGGKFGSRVPDEELPDPDKVRHARELFERVLKIESLENMLRGGGRPKTAHPKAAAPTTEPGSPQQPQAPQYTRPTPEIRQPVQQHQHYYHSNQNHHPQHQHHHHHHQHQKLQKSLSVDTGHAQTSAPTALCRWTDNGSVSSGVGSDISAETDLELSPKGGGTPASRGGSECGSKEDDVVVFTSEEDLSGQREASEELGKPISADVLSSIREYGTSVTYYGGKIIASSKGHACSPMTMTIMNEIKQCSPDYHANRKFLFDDKQLSKYRLVKSNSCGSRLELSGTDEYGSEYERRLNVTHPNQHQHNQQQPREDHNNNEMRRETDTIKEEEEDEQQQQSKKHETRSKPDDALIAAKIKNDNSSNLNGWCGNTKNALQNGRPNENDKTYCDMEFEEFEVLEETKKNA